MNNFVLVAGNLHIEYRRGDSGDSGIFVAERLDIVKRIGGATRTSRFEASVYDLFKLTLADEEVDYELKITVRVLGVSHGEFRARDVLRNTVVEDNSARGGLNYTRMFRSVGQRYFTSYVNFILTPELFGLISHQSFVGRRINVRLVVISRYRFGRISALFYEFARNDYIFKFSFRSRINSVLIGFRYDAFIAFYDIRGNEFDILFVIEETVVLKNVFGFSFVIIFALFFSRNGKVIATENHILRGRHNRLTVGKLQNVVGSKHQESRFRLSFDGKRNVNCHLVSVEVRVERAANKRVKLDCSAFDEDRLESLNGETVKRGSAVQKNGVILDNVFENIPHAGFHSLDHSLRALYVMASVVFHKFFHNERLEKFDRHLLGKTALIKFEFGTYDYNRTSGIVDTFSEKVLTETTLFTS